MALLDVPQAKLLHEAAMGRILALEYMLSGTRGLLQPCPIMPDTKRHRILRPRC
jgi:hypothetical protein